jgi:hypothetical protein
LPKRRAHFEGELSPLRYEHCLYLLAEIDRLVDTAVAAWSAGEAGAIESRLVQIIEKLRVHTRPQ